MCNKTCFYVRDNALVGDLKDAVEKTIWRMDLSRVHAVSFKVVHNGSTWDLGMEGPKGEFTPVASYDTAQKAQRALRRMSSALRQSGWGRRLVSFVFLLLFLFVMYEVVLFVAGGLSTSKLFSAAAPSATGQVQIQQGQSTSADMALKPPVSTP